MTKPIKTPDESEKNWFPGTETHKISLHLKLQYIVGEDRRWHLHIIVDEMTTATELRKAWGKIDEAREKLKRIQGTDTKWASISLLIDLEQRKANSSYEELAKDVNFDLLVFLLWAADEAKGQGRAQAGSIVFGSLLIALGIKNESINNLLKDGKADIAKNKLPWSLINGPINRRRIVDSLRQFSRDKKSSQIVIRPPESAERIRELRISALVYKYWLKASDLLKHQKPDEFESYKKRFDQRTIELLPKPVEFSGSNFQ